MFRDAYAHMCACENAIDVAHEKETKKKIENRIFCGIVSIRYCFVWDVCDSRQAPAVPTAVSLALAVAQAIVSTSRFATECFIGGSFGALSIRRVTANRRDSLLNEHENKRRRRNKCVERALCRTHLLHVVKNIFWFGSPKKPSPLRTRNYLLNRREQTIYWHVAMCARLRPQPPHQFATIASAICMHIFRSFLCIRSNSDWQRNISGKMPTLSLKIATRKM